METKIQAHETVGQIVRQNFRTAAIFKRSGIDFCCGGNVSLVDAAQKKGLNIDQLITELQATEAPAVDYDAWPVDRLTAHLVNTHHEFIRHIAPELLAFSQRVAKVHGANFTYLVEMSQIVATLVEELLSHLQKEETILFPAILELQRAQAGLPANWPPPFHQLRNPITVMEHEHDEVGTYLKKLRELAADYTLPPEACTTWRVSWEMLQSLEDDLHQHIHLENNVLFPKAQKLEQTLNG